MEWSLMKRLIWLHVISGGGGVLTTVTGASPLTLANAIAKSIKSLIQYGKCTTVDDETYCNNGKLVAVDDELPSGYTRITGIKFDGDFYYNTGEVLNGDDVVTMTLANTATTGQNVFGSYNGTSAGTKNFSLFIYGGGSNSNSYFRYGEQLLRPKFGSNEHTITLGGNGTTGFTNDVTATPETFTTTATAYIGMLPNSSSPAYTGSVIGSITVGTRLKWIPCERVNDGVIGYYEAVNGTFLEPVGTGTPVAGSYDTSHLNVLSVEGTPEVLTVYHNAFGAHFVRYLNAYIKTSNRQITAYAGNSVATFDCEVGKTYRAFDLASTNDKTSVTVGFSDSVPDVNYVYQTSDLEVMPAEGGYKANGLVFTARKRYATFIFRYDTDSSKTPESMLEQFVFAEVDTAQTASLVNLFSTGTVHDEQDVVSGTVTRRTAVSVSGGVVTVSALAEPVTEQVTPQPIRTAEGINIVTVASAVAPVELSATYTAEEE